MYIDKVYYSVYNILILNNLNNYLNVCEWVLNV